MVVLSVWVPRLPTWDCPHWALRLAQRTKKLSLVIALLSGGTASLPAEKLLAVPAFPSYSFPTQQAGASEAGAERTPLENGHLPLQPAHGFRKVSVDSVEAGGWVTLPSRPGSWRW